MSDKPAPKSKLQKAAAKSLLSIVNELPIEAIEQITAFAEIVRNQSQSLKTTFTHFVKDEPNQKKVKSDFPWPEKKFSESGEKDALGFIKKHWTPLLKQGLVCLKDIEQHDPQVFAAISWPAKNIYSTLRLEGEITDIKNFLERHWKNHIDAGLVNMQLLRKHDLQAAKAIYNYQRLMPLPTDLHIPTLKELNDVALVARMKLGLGWGNQRLTEARRRRVLTKPNT